MFNLVKECRWVRRTKISHPWGAWGAQSVKHLTFAFGSGPDIGVVRSSPTSDSMLSAELA